MNKKNKEGYKDPTAHEAIQNVMNESKEKRMKRGEVYYIEPYDKSGIGSEQRAGRPAVIVSNDKCNEYSEVLEVVYLTTQPKADLPTHVTIRSTPRESTALCEQITSVSTSRFGDMVCRLSKDELVNIEIGCLISLDLSTGSKEKVITKEVVKEVPVEVIKEVIKEVPAPPSEEVGAGSNKRYVEAMNKLAAANAKCDMLQSMYDSLLSRVIGSKAV